MRFPQGQPVRATVQVRDLTGSLVGPTTIVFDLLTPTGLPAVVGPTPTLDSLGNYHVDLASDISAIGHYVLRWTTTGPGAGVKTDTLDVYDPFGAELLSLSDGKKYLNIAEVNTVHDDEVLSFIRALTPTIEFFVGPVEPRTLVRTVRGSGREIALPVAPVLEVVSIDNGYGTLNDLTGIVVDEETGTISVAPSGWFPRDATVTFLAGRREVSATINHAAKVQLAHLWETQRGRGSNSFSARQSTAGDTTYVPGLGYAVPNRVIELLKPVGTRTGLS